MELYQDFCRRIGEFEVEKLDLGKSYFRGRASLVDKIDEGNKLKPFYGDTVVFDLDDSTKETLSFLISEIYFKAGECLAERLDASTMHMTLHDLSSNTQLSDVAEEMASNFEKIKEISITRCKILIKTTYIFNMVNTSLVMGLVPCCEKDFDALMKLYSTFEQVKIAPYPLTPHITLAYFNVHGFDEMAKIKLEEAVNKLNSLPSFTVELDTSRLFYQRFYSMSHYENILSF